MYKQLIITIILFLFFDFTYLYLTSGFTVPLIQKIQNAPIKLDFIALVLVYIFDIFLLYYFIILPNLSITKAFLLGMCVYGVFEFTNKSLFKNYSYTLCILDTIWGGLLFSLTTFFSRFLCKKIFF